jgi:hypothetical protein
MPVYQKGSKKPKKERINDRGNWEAIRALGCHINNSDCCQKIEIHHPTGAGMALKANDADVIPLCFNHHSAQTPLGYGHAVHKGTKVFEEIYGTQAEMVEITKQKLALLESL